MTTDHPPRLPWPAGQSERLCGGPGRARRRDHDLDGEPGSKANFATTRNAQHAKGAAWERARHLLERPLRLRDRLSHRNRGPEPMSSAIPCRHRGFPGSGGSRSAWPRPRSCGWTAKLKVEGWTQVWRSRRPRRPVPAMCVPGTNPPGSGQRLGQGLVPGASSQRAQGSRQTTHLRVTAPQAQYS